MNTRPSSETRSSRGGSKRLRSNALLIAAVIIVGVALIGLIVVTKPEVSTVEEPVRKLEQVEVREVVAAPFRREITLLGTADALLSAAVAAEIAGNIVAVSPRCEPGMRVEKGEVLVEIDPAQYKIAHDGAAAALAEAEASLQLQKIENAAEAERLTVFEGELQSSKQELDRKETLVKTGVISGSEFDQENTRHAVIRQRYLSQQSRVRQSKALLERSRANLAAARSRFEQAELDMARTKVRAPFTGEIVGRAVELGNRIQTGDMVFRIINADTVVVDVDIPSSALNITQTVNGVPAVEVEDEAGGVTRQGKLTHVSPRADPDTRLFAGEIYVDNIGGGGRILPGRFVTVKIIEAEPVTAVAVPFAAITYDSGGDYAFTVQEGDPATAKKRYLRITWRQGESALVEGLTPGERLVVRGQENLFDGAPVRVDEGRE